MPNRGEKELDHHQVKHENSHYEVVFVDIPEIELDPENKIIVKSNPPPNGMETYLVPQAVAEETVEGFCSEDILTDCEHIETDPFANDSPKDNDPPWKPPRISVRSMIEMGTSSTLKKHRRKQVFPKLEDEPPIVSTKPLLKNPSDSCPPAKDLMWLLNFKLDPFLQNNPLDDGPTAFVKCLKDSKKSENGTNNEQSDRKSIDCNEILKKPPFTYTELIECALYEKGPLTVAEIYQWISDMFPYYKVWDDRWKNSVRHNLSINPYFRKGGKAKQGSGHLWTVSEGAETPRSLLAKRQKYQELDEYTKRIKLKGCEMSKNIAQNDLKLREEEEAREAEIAASIIYKIIEDKENHIETMPAQDGDVLQSVGDIFAGAKKRVAVEYIDENKSGIGNDFLNPVSKEVLMGECGFLTQIELNMTAESVDNFDLIESETNYEHLDDLGFQFNELGTQNNQLQHLVQ